MSQSESGAEAPSPDARSLEILMDRDLPELHVSAHAVSNSAQRRFSRSTGIQLVLLVAAAVFGAISFTIGENWGKFVAAGAFFSAAILKTHVLATKPDAVWYEARAAAESAKTLAWRYAVGGEPFVVNGSGPAETDRLFLARLREVLTPLKGIPIAPSTQRIEQITEKMRRIRSLPLEERQTSYLNGRIIGQRAWYTGKALWNRRRANQWSGLMLVSEVIGGSAALLQTAGVALLPSVGVIEFNLLGISAAVAGIAAAWTQTKQYSSLASAYSVAARELADIEILMGQPSREQDWASFVAHAEDAISREHTLWRASRGG